MSLFLCQGDGNANVDLEKDRIETRGLSKHAKVSLCPQ
jgi:hypothetical protein